MPVSLTAIASIGSSECEARAGKKRMRISPSLVNFSAFENRLRMIWKIRWWSLKIVNGAPGSTSTVKRRCLASAIGRKLRSMLATNSSSGMFSYSTVIRPASIFDKSRMSLISANKSLPERWMMSACVTCFALRLP